MVVVTVLVLHVGQLGVMFDNNTVTVEGCCWYVMVVVTVLGVQDGQLDVKRWLASYRVVGHMLTLTVVRAFSVSVWVMVLVTVVELVTVVVIVVESSSIDVGFMHMRAVVLLGKSLSCGSGQPIWSTLCIFTVCWAPSLHHAAIICLQIFSTIHWAVDILLYCIPPRSWRLISIVMLSPKSTLLEHPEPLALWLSANIIPGLFML